MKRAFIYSDAYEIGGYPDNSPFKTGRPGATKAMCEEMGLLTPAEVVEPVPATREELETCHSAAYLDALERAGAGTLDADGLEYGLPGGDCPLWSGMDGYLYRAAGAALTGARLILEGSAAVVFTPMGGFHHAFPERAAGFCYLNDVVLAAKHLAAAGRRVAVLDVDVHHGDGTQHAFYERNDVLTVSIHQDTASLFPGIGGGADDIGRGAGEGYAVNLPMPPGTHDAAWLRALRQGALPVIDAYEPDIVVCELGLDALKDDPLADLALTNNAYAAVVDELMIRGKPLLFTGGGGYHFAHTVRGWTLCWSVMRGGADHDMNLGMGGVMLENQDWAGGLRDRDLVLDDRRVAQVEAAVDETLATVRESVFPTHGL